MTAQFGTFHYICSFPFRISEGPELKL